MIISGIYYISKGILIIRNSKKKYYKSQNDIKAIVAKQLNIYYNIKYERCEANLTYFILYIYLTQKPGKFTK